MLIYKYLQQRYHQVRVYYYGIIRISITVYGQRQFKIIILNILFRYPTMTIKSRLRYVSQCGHSIALRRRLRFEHVNVTSFSTSPSRETSEITLVSEAIYVIYVVDSRGEDYGVRLLFTRIVRTPYKLTPYCYRIPCKLCSPFHSVYKVPISCVSCYAARAVLLNLTC